MGLAKSNSQCTRLLAPQSLSASRELASTEGTALRLMTYNMLEFNVAKKATKVLQVQADIITEQNPDIVVMQEVSSEESLQEFNRSYLNDAYQVFFAGGNDSRGFEIAMLVKKGLNKDFSLEYRSHKHQQFFDQITGVEMPIFSRDAPTLIVKSRESGETKLVLLGVHAKSKRPRDGDPESRWLRTQQMGHLKKLVEGFQTEFGQSTPILLAGDFNTGIHDSPETTEILQIMTDVFDLLARPPPGDDRFTHSFHPRGGKPSYNQIDGILIVKTPKAQIQNANVIRYKDRNGNARPLARNFKDRSTQPSDHFPLVADILIY